MKVGLIECDHVDERFSAIAGGYPEMFEKLLGPHVPDLELARYDACHGQLPAIGACAGYVCTGSRASVYEDEPWIDALKELVRAFRDARKPFVGICFGHQLLAEALGGKVAKSDRGWGVGVHDMNVSRPEPWMKPALASCRLQYMHQDQVQSLPPGAVLLGRGEHCELAMFRVGDTLLGIEGHPEFPAEYNAALIGARAERIGAERAKAGLASLAQPTDAAAVGAWIAAFYRQILTST